LPQIAARHEVYRVERMGALLSSCSTARDRRRRQAGGAGYRGRPSAERGEIEIRLRTNGATAPRVTGDQLEDAVLERREYDKLNAVEDEMWWFRGSHANLLTAFHGHAGRLPSGPLLDAGCGTGGLLAKLARELPEGRPIGSMPMPWHAPSLGRKAAGRSAPARPMRWPFATGSLAAIFSADVLCHRNVDEVRALADFHRCLAGGGLLVMNLPSYQWLLSAHDHAVHNVRRYTQRRVRALLQGAGFARIRMTYGTPYSSLMVLGRLGAQARGQRRDAFPGPLELAFRGIMRIENRLLGHGIRLPFGGSSWQRRSSHDPTRLHPQHRHSGSITRQDGRRAGRRACALSIKGGHEIILVNDGSPDNSLAVCRDLMRKLRGAAYRRQLARNFRRAQRRHGRLREARGAWVITMDDDLQNPERGRPPPRICAGERQGGDLYLVRQQGTRRLAQSRQPLHQQGRRRAARQAAGAFTSRASAASAPSSLRMSPAMPDPSPISTASSSRSPRASTASRSSTCRAPRTQQLHAAPADPAVAQYVRQFLGDAAAPQHADRHRHQRLRRHRHGSGFIEAMYYNTPPGLGFDHGRRALAVGRAAPHLGIVGEYLGRLYLTINGKPQSIVATVERASAAQAPAPPPAGVGIERLASRRA